MVRLFSRASPQTSYRTDLNSMQTLRHDAHGVGQAALLRDNWYTTAEDVCAMPEVC